MTDYDPLAGRTVPDAACVVGLGVWYANGSLVPDNPLMIIENFLTAFGPILFQELAPEREAAIAASKAAQARMLATLGPRSTKTLSIDEYLQMNTICDEVNKAKALMVKGMFWLKANPLSLKTQEETKALDPEEKVYKRKIRVLALANRLSDLLTKWSLLS